MSNKVPAFATVDPFDGMTGNAPGVLQNLVGGEWVSVSDVNKDIIDPMNGESFVEIPDTRDPGCRAIYCRAEELPENRVA
jgi:hypothetical protein